MTKHVVVNKGSEAAHFESTHFGKTFSAKCAASLPRAPPIAPVMLNAAQRSEASLAIDYQLSTKLVISNAAKRSEGYYKGVYQLITCFSNAINPEPL